MTHPSTRWGTVLALGAIVAVYLAQVAPLAGQINDDAYITFRYSRFLVLGRGPYFNIGEHVEGYTNFLLMVLVALAIKLGGADAAAPFAKGLGVLCGGIGVLASFALGRQRVEPDLRDNIGATITGLLAAGIVALAPGYAVNSTTGLETTLFAALVAAAVLVGITGNLQGKWRGSGFLFAAAALTRPEGVFLFAVYWLTASVSALAAIRNASPDPTADRARNFGLLRSLLIDGCIFTSIMALHLTFRRVFYDGEWLPNTFYAKAGGWPAASALSYVREGALWPVFGPAGFLLGVAGYLARNGIRRAAAPLLATGVAGCLLPSFTGTDWMPGWRLVTPYLPLVAPPVAAGWYHLSDRLLRKFDRRATLLVFAILPLLWIYQEAPRKFFKTYVSMRAEGYRTAHAALADWLCHETLASGATVALMDIGIIGYRCIDLRILDITGLTDRFIAKSTGAFMAKEFDPGYVLDPQPDFIVLTFDAPIGEAKPPHDLSALRPFSPAEAQLLANPEFRRRYTRAVGRPGSDLPWTDVIAARIGAERVYSHDYPDRYYLLAVYRRQKLEESFGGELGIESVGRINYG